MKIKTFFSIFLMTLFLINTAFGFSAIRTTLINQNPNPANLGKYVELKFQIENIGTDDVKNVMVELTPEYPFFLDPNEESTRIIGSMSAGRVGENAATVTYKVRIDEKAVEGQNKIKLRYRKNDNDQWISQEFDVNIRSLSYAMNINSIKTIPEELKPGQRGKLEIEVENLGYNTLRDLSFQIILASYDSNTGFNDFVPLATVQSSTVKKKSFLEPGDKTTFVYDIIASPDAQSDIYKVPITFSYYDSENQRIENTDIIGIVIGDKPTLVTYIQNSNIVTPGKTGRLTIHIVNKGITDAKFVDVKVLEGENYNILSTQDDFYIGSVNSDDYEYFDLDLFVKEGASNLKIPLEIFYKDPNNKEYSENVELELKLYSLEEAKSMGLYKESNNTTTFVVLGIVILLFVFWRFNKKRKNKSKK